MEVTSFPNSTVVRRKHLLKQDWPTVVTPSGMVMVTREVHL